jgi:NADPH:quinone reductase-like Zn-dependent oxidoreductase
VKAAVNTRYGSPDVIEVREVPKPRPKAGEVLVKVRASTVSRTDCGYLRAHPFFVRAFSGLRRPTDPVLGMDFAGVIEEVAPEVTIYAPGDRVFGLTPRDHGGHAEYVCVPEEGAMALVPEGLEFGEAVVCEGALYANTNLEGLGLKPGDKILVYGASGAIGTAAVQLAKSRGAEVTAVVDTRHLELASGLGADHVIDYTTGDFTRSVENFDFVLDAVGKAGYFRCRTLLKPEGSYAASDLGPWGQNLAMLLWARITRSRRMIFPIPKSTKTFVEFLRARMEAGEFRAVIDRTYPLERIADAYRYVETGQKTGIVVVLMPPTDSERPTDGERPADDARTAGDPPPTATPEETAQQR